MQDLAGRETRFVSAPSDPPRCHRAGSGHLGWHSSPSDASRQGSARPAGWGRRCPHNVEAIMVTSSELSCARRRVEAMAFMAQSARLNLSRCDSTAGAEATGFAMPLPFPVGFLIASLCSWLFQRRPLRKERLRRFVLGSTTQAQPAAYIGGGLLHTADTGSLNVCRLLPSQQVPQEKFESPTLAMMRRRPARVDCLQPRCCALPMRRSSTLADALVAERLRCVGGDVAHAVQR
jgi:hypothetical protein